MTNQSNESKATQYLTVYRKRSTFKGATDRDYWYSATLSNGNSVVCVFKCPIQTESAAFRISNVIGTSKHSIVESDGVTYTNYTYYITSCDFGEIAGEELPL